MKPEIIEKIARIAHEANRAYSEEIGEDTAVEWENAPDWQKESIRDGVVFHKENPDAGFSETHDAWVKDKLANGWTYGEVKDAEKKTHPSLVPYAELPKAQRGKDVLIRFIVNALIKEYDTEEEPTAKVENEEGVPEEAKPATEDISLEDKKEDKPDAAELPDGSGAMVASFELPKDHWVYDETGDPPEEPLTNAGREKIAEAAKYAIKASTMSGKEMDFDPDAMVQNIIIAMAGENKLEDVAKDKAKKKEEDK